MKNNTDTRRIVIVTGGARGIGSQVAERFASKGDIVILFDADEKSGAAAAQSLQKKNNQAF